MLYREKLIIKIWIFMKKKTTFLKIQEKVLIFIKILDNTSDI